MQLLPAAAMSQRCLYMLGAPNRTDSAHVWAQGWFVWNMRASGREVCDTRICTWVIKYATMQRPALQQE